MFSKKNKKSGFTLIEMLIVIVIIGILAAAIIPRLSSARGRANDVARKADLAQVAAALVAFQIDRGRFPNTSGTLASISTDLIGAGMSSIPTDPVSNRTIPGISTVTGQYYYAPISKGSIPANGFVVIAAAETEGGANWDLTSGLLGTSYDSYEEILSGMCNQNCVKNGDNLKYIYLY